MKTLFSFFVCLCISSFLFSQVPDDIFITAGEPQDLYGYSVSSAGDINNDGYADVIVGAYGADVGAYDFGGKAYIYLGSPDGINDTADFITEVVDFDAETGYAVSGAGDINADGYDDIIVGARHSNTVHIYYGAASGISAVFSDTLEVTMPASSEFGSSVSGAGDVNGDGYDDIIIGAPGYSNVETAEGAFYIFHGSATGIISTAALKVESNQSGADMGVSVSGAGDVNGDGYADVVVGAPYYDAPSLNEGKVYFYYGSPAGISFVPAASVEGNQPEAYMGISVSAAGDINADGYDDVVVGAQQFIVGSSHKGRAFIYYGGASGINTASPTTINGETASGEFAHSVADAGDVNADGYADIIIGARLFDSEDHGKVYVFKGSASGISTTPSFTATGTSFYETLGISVSGTGDINGDGYDDIIAGGAFQLTPSPGLAYVHYMGCDVPLTFYADADADSYGNSASSIIACSAPTGYVLDNTDCNDAVATIYPGATEICNGIDDNCNALIDDGAVLIATVTPAGPTVFCAGESVVLSAPVVAGYMYQWKKNTVSIPGATAANFTAVNTGQYQVYITSGTCADISDSVAVTKNPKPSPMINNLDATNDLCFDTSIKLKTAAGAGYTYQWYKGAAAIAGATGNVHFAVLPGNYKVKATNSFGCSKMSPPYTIIKTCKLKAAENTFTINIYPNPADDDLFINLTFDDAVKTRAGIFIYNITGELMYTDAEDVKDGILLKQIHFKKSLPEGMYVVKITAEDKNYVQQIIITH